MSEARKFNEPQEGGARRGSMAWNWSEVFAAAAAAARATAAVRNLEFGL